MQCAAAAQGQPHKAQADERSHGQTRAGTKGAVWAWLTAQFLRAHVQAIRVKQHTPEQHELDSMQPESMQPESMQPDTTKQGNTKRASTRPATQAGQKAKCRCWQLRRLVTHGGAQACGVALRPCAGLLPASGCPPRRRFCGHAQGNAQRSRPNNEPRQGRGSARKSLLPCPGGAKSHQAKLNKLT